MNGVQSNTFNPELMRKQAAIIHYKLEYLYQWRLLLSMRGRMRDGWKALEWQNTAEWLFGALMLHNHPDAVINSEALTDTETFRLWAQFQQAEPRDVQTANHVVKQLGDLIEAAQLDHEETRGLQMFCLFYIEQLRSANLDLRTVLQELTALEL